MSRFFPYLLRDLTELELREELRELRVELRNLLNTRPFDTRLYRGLRHRYHSGVELLEGGHDFEEFEDLVIDEIVEEVAEELLDDDDVDIDEDEIDGDEEEDED